MGRGALVLILGRAGSKGVPGKNLALVAGRECFRWTLDAAQESRRAERIVVSSDSNEMLQIAMQVGVDGVARPAHLASDSARVDEAARHAVEAIGDTSSDAIVILYANVPVRPAGLVDRAIDLLRSTGADSVQSYAPVGKHHPWWTARIDDESAVVSPWEGERMNNGVYRRQDLPPAFIPDGGVLAVTPGALFGRARDSDPDSPHAFLGADWRAVINQEGNVIDIDSPLDLTIADAILRERARSFGEPPS